MRPSCERGESHLEGVNATRGRRKKWKKEEKKEKKKVLPLTCYTRFLVSARSEGGSKLRREFMSTGLRSALWKRLLFSPSLSLSLSLRTRSSRSERCFSYLAVLSVEPSGSKDETTGSETTILFRDEERERERVSRDT